MLTRQGAAQLIAAEFQRLSTININHPDYTNVPHIVYRPVEFLMADKTIATLLSKNLEQTPKFSGTPDQDADEWLKDLITTFRMANITEANALNIIPIFLEGHAKQWYSDNKDIFESWNSFKAEFIRTYSSPTTKQLASNRLRTRLQRYDEPIIEYYTDVLKLCNLVDPSMTDASKIDHLYHGLKNSLMKEVLRQNPQTPSDFLQHARQEETLERLVTTSAQHTNDFIASNVPYNESPYSTSTTVYTSYPTSSTMHRDWHPPPTTQYPSSPSHYQQSPSRTNFSPRYSSANTSYSSGQSIRCYSCHKLGHIARHCRSTKNF